MKRIETRADIRYKAYKEMLNFVNWLAEKHPKEWKKYVQEYSNVGKANK